MRHLMAIATTQNLMASMPAQLVLNFRTTANLLVYVNSVRMRELKNRSAFR